VLVRCRTLAILAVVLTSTMGASAQAAAPSLLGAAETGGHLTVSWSLPSGAVSALVEVSNDPGIAPDGDFYSGGIQDDEALQPALTTWTSQAAFDPGTYYVHVAGIDPVCYFAGQCPSREFSGVARIVVVDAPLALTVSPARGGTIASSRIGIACPGTCSASWRRGTAIVLTARPSRGWRFKGWSTGPCAGRALPDCRVVVAAGLADARAAFVRLRVPRRP
jgi:List-Bact-rpt repeat protein